MLPISLSPRSGTSAARSPAVMLFSTLLMLSTGKRDLFPEKGNDGIYHDDECYELQNGRDNQEALHDFIDRLAAVDHLDAAGVAGIRVQRDTHGIYRRDQEKVNRPDMLLSVRLASNCKGAVVFSAIVAPLSSVNLIERANPLFMWLSIKSANVFPLLSRIEVASASSCADCKTSLFSFDSRYPF